MAFSSKFLTVFLVVPFATRLLRADLLPPASPAQMASRPAVPLLPTFDDRIVIDSGEQSSPEARERMETAAVLMTANKSAEAEKTLVDATHEFPREPGLLVSLARLYYSQRRFDKADQALQAALKLKESPFLYLDLGTLYAEGFNKPVEAVDYFYKALALDPNLPGAHFALGQLLGKLDQADQARKEYGESTRLDPKNTRAWIALARLERRSGQTNPALAAYEHAVTVSPDDPLILEEVANFHAGLGQNEQALKEFTLAAERAPRSPLVWSDLGMFLQSQHRYPEADQAYQKALALEPRLAAVLNNRAYMAFELGGDLTAALAWARTATEIAPKNAYFLDTLGVILRRVSQLAEAKIVLERATTANADYATARFHLAQVEHDLGQSADAKQNLDRLLATAAPFPERKSAQELRSQLSDSAAPASK